ncbi:hypothetical protein, partial [Marinospirillum sp.]|uniref:hypothetical protein n=1 Tax=Marinospirillum sp. TaxID=2183934 RepID=UPI0028700933
VSDQIRTNLVIENKMMDAENANSSQIWVNAFYTMPSGLEWGAELTMLSADTSTVANGAYPGNTETVTATNGYAVSDDGDMRFALQAKYAF